MIPVTVGRVRLGEGTLVLIAGPCAIEGPDHALRTAEALKRLAQEAGLPLIYKSSYDKANRLSLESYRGPGLEEGLRILARVKEEVGVPVISDIHSAEQAAPAAEVLDAIQIPALLCRQTDIVVAAARTGKPVFIKKGQFMAPADMASIAAKAQASGSGGVVLVERGTTFGYNNLVVDFRSLPVMRDIGVPVVFDATHSVQLPGAAVGRSGGQRRFAAPLARAAVAVGVDGVFFEVHEAPDRAPCDGPNMLSLDELGRVLPVLVALSRVRAEAVDTPGGSA